MPKIFILDTNVLLHDPGALFEFEENTIIIPISVIEELDKFKNYQGELGHHAREVGRTLDRLTEGCNSFNGIPVGNGNLIIDVQEQNTLILDFTNPDNRLLSCAAKHKGIVVSRDRNVRIKARAFGLRAEDYEAAKVVTTNGLYTGYRELDVDPALVNDLHAAGFIDDPFGLSPNEFAILRSSPQHIAIGRKINSKLVRRLLNTPRRLPFEPLNLQQKMALDLLLDPDVPVVSLSGVAGSGKNILAIGVGLEMIDLNERFSYNHMIYTKSVVELKEQALGFLPGELEEKLRPHLQPLWDTFEFLLCDADSADSDEMVTSFKERGLLSVFALAYLRGVSMQHKWIVVDEAQNITPSAMKTIVTRVKDNSKLVVIGDPDQVDDRHLDRLSNGLVHLLVKGQPYDVAGHISLPKVERGRVAEFGAEAL